MEYRRFVDDHIFQLLLFSDSHDVKTNIILGIHHEQQHQELLLMDIKYILSKCFSSELYHNKKSFIKSESFALEYLNFEGGIVDIGADSKIKFYFDNEAPEFKYFQYPYSLATRPISNREYLEFINYGGYSNPLLWKSDGWDYIHTTKDLSPLYWEKKKMVCGLNIL
jgi:formylglycine-generating enzyme required for sulfatase activity